MYGANHHQAMKIILLIASFLCIFNQMEAQHSPTDTLVPLSNKISVLAALSHLKIGGDSVLVLHMQERYSRSIRWYQEIDDDIDIRIWITVDSFKKTYELECYQQEQEEEATLLNNIYVFPFADYFLAFRQWYNIREKLSHGVYRIKWDYRNREIDNTYPLKLYKNKYYYCDISFVSPTPDATIVQFFFGIPIYNKRGTRYENKWRRYVLIEDVLYMFDMTLFDFTTSSSYRKTLKNTQKAKDTFDEFLDRIIFEEE